MKYIFKSVFLASSILLLFPFIFFGQNAQSGDASKNKLISVAKEIMTDAGICALITLDEEGRPRARAMDAFEPESDLTVWFGTNPHSRKVTQIENDPRVTLYYLDKDASGYVMIHGLAQIVDDQKEKQKWWKDEWQAFYPNKQEGYVLIKVSPEWMEVLSQKNGISNDSLTWQPPMVIFNTNQ